MSKEGIGEGRNRSSWAGRKPPVRVIRQVAIVTVIGSVFGLAGALALGRAASALLYELKGYDPVVMAMSAGVLVVVALGAG